MQCTICKGVYLARNIFQTCYYNAGKTLLPLLLLCYQLPVTYVHDQVLLLPLLLKREERKIP